MKEWYHCLLQLARRFLLRHVGSLRLRRKTRICLDDSIDRDNCLFYWAQVRQSVCLSDGETIFELHIEVKLISAQLPADKTVNAIKGLNEPLYHRLDGAHKTAIFEYKDAEIE